MGSCFSDESRIEPRELEELNGEEDGRKIERNREATDKVSLGIMAVYILIFSGLVIYTALHGDLYRLLNGYDSCGNICGRKNSEVAGISCSGLDMTDKPYLLVTNNTITKEFKKQCLSKCPTRYTPVAHRCIRTNGTSGNEPDITTFFQDLASDFYKTWPEILGLCFLALVYSVIMVVLFRFATKVVVWFMLIGGLLMSVAVTIFLWIHWGAVKQDKQRQNEVTSWLIGAIFATVFSCALVLIIIVMRTKIRLVIQIIKEAGKAIAAMPLILFEPVLTFLAVTIGGFIWVYFLLVSSTAGSLKLIDSSNNLYEYVENGVMVASIAMSFVTAMWMFYFMVDCQHMIIAGSVARWFFTRNKNNLGSPIIKSAYTTIRFHLGTISLGSLIVTLFMIVKACIKALIQSASNNSNSGWAVFIKCCVNWCLETLEDLLKYFTRNAYIITAIYGHTFCTAGKRAFHVLTNNIYNVAAINSVGDFVLNLAKFFIFLLTTVVAYEVFKDKEGVEMSFIPIAIVALFTLCIGHMFMTVYEMSIDTIFICFCEDFEENDGLSKPYYMSKELMEFVKNSHKLLDKKPENQEQETV